MSTSTSIAIAVLTGGSLGLLALRMVIQRRTKALERHIFAKINSGQPEGHVLVVDYKSRSFKSLDAHLSRSGLPKTKVVFIATSWLFKAKSKVWRADTIFIDSGTVEASGFTRVLRRTPSGEIKASGAIRDYLNQWNGERSWHSKQTS